MTQRLLLITGIPGTGKTEAGRHLRDHHGFIHVDVEDLITQQPTTHAAILQRIAAARRTGRGVVVTWGFWPGNDDSAIRGIQGMGFTMVWFNGEHAAARRAFLRRGTVTEQAFNDQIARIAKLDLASFSARRFDPFDERGEFLPRETIAERLIEMG